MQRMLKENPNAGFHLLSKLCILMGKWNPCWFSVCAAYYVDSRKRKFPVNHAFNAESAESKYLIARPGDWILSPFQCEHFWIVNLHGRQPVRGQFLDEQELIFLRRANLGMFWSHESGTVKGLVYDMKDIIKRSSWRGRSTIPLTQVIPWDIDDSMGMGIALHMLEKSIESGRNNSTYTKFDTVRKFRSTASNVYSSTAGASKNLRVLKSLKGTILHTHTHGGSMQSIFMERFTLGLG